MKLSNKVLAIVVVFAISLSLFSTMVILNRLSTLQRMPTTTGKANYDMGDVRLEISSVVSIVLLNDTIDFGSGYVNDSCLASVNNATLTAGETYDDTSGNDCWTATEEPTSLHIENDGNENVTLKVYGPTNESFFEGTDTIPYSGTNPYALRFRARDYEAGSCDVSTGGSFQDAWIDFNGVNRTICDDFLYQNTDELAVDVLVIIPVDLSTDTYQNSTIEFTARSN